MHIAPITVAVLRSKMLMSRLHPEADPDDIIFSTPEGKTIGDRMFRERIWQPTCKRAGVHTLHVTSYLATARHRDHGLDITPIGSNRGLNLDLITAYKIP